MNDSQSQPSHRRRASRIVRVSAYWLLFVVGLTLAMECVLRLAFGLGTPPLYTPDPHYGYALKENQHLRRFRNEIDTNALGMRSDAASASKPAGEYRILFVGDSITYGTARIDQSGIFVEQIARALRSRAGPHYEVLNASAPGWAPSNEFEYLRQRGLFDADRVVIVYNTKDLAQAFAPFIGPPLYPSENPTAIGELWIRYLQPRLFHTAAPADPGSTETQGPPSAAQAEQVLQTIESTRELVSSRGAQFSVVLVPIVTPDVRQNQAAWDQRVAELKLWAHQQGVPLLDLTPLLTSRPADELYFDGVHLRQPANDLVAHALLEWLPTQARSP